MRKEVKDLNKNLNSFLVKIKEFSRKQNETKTLNLTGKKGDWNREPVEITRSLFLKITVVKQTIIKLLTNELFGFCTLA